MKFYISSAFLNTREIIEIAKAADELGYDGIGIPDHVVNLETLETPYPYTKDGQRRWQPFTDWPDPWVLIGALAQVTTRLRFVNTVYIPAMRNPYSAAKAIGTAAVLASGRVELGIGVGWCREEFALMGEQFDARGKRTDEIIELDAGAVAAGLDGVRRRRSTGHRDWRWSRRRRRYPCMSAGSATLRCAAPPATTAGSAT